LAGKSSWRFFEHGLRFAKAMVSDSDSQFLVKLNQELNDAGFGEFQLDMSAQNASAAADKIGRASCRERDLIVTGVQTCALPI